MIIGGNFSGHSDAAWNQRSVLRVANEIKKLCSSSEVSTPDSASHDVRWLFYFILINSAVLISLPLMTGSIMGKVKRVIIIPRHKILYLFNYFCIWKYISHVKWLPLSENFNVTICPRLLYFGLLLSRQPF